MTTQDIINDLRSDNIKKIILDTDTYNEIDDQYAVAYAMRSSEKLELLALCAAPFFNSRSSSAGDGMIKSYDEIHKIASLSNPSHNIPIYKGSERFLSSKETPVESDACEAIARLVLESSEPVYIVAIGAITNVASAIIKYPEIIDKTAVIWLGGHALHYHRKNTEFNLRGDVCAAQVVFDSGIPLLQIPCAGVCSEFFTTIPELEYYIKNKNPLCDYLLDVTKNYTKDPYAWSKVIWDVTAIAVFTRPQAFDMDIIPRPCIDSDTSYLLSTENTPYVYVRRIHRDPIFADLFRKLSV